MTMMMEVVVVMVEKPQIHTQRIKEFFLDISNHFNTQKGVPFLRLVATSLLAHMTTDDGRWVMATVCT
jgi:hypothetical protein